MIRNHNQIDAADDGVVTGEEESQELLGDLYEDRS